MATEDPRDVPFRQSRDRRIRFFNTQYQFCARWHVRFDLSYTITDIQLGRAGAVASRRRCYLSMAAYVETKETPDLPKNSDGRSDANRIHCIRVTLPSFIRFCFVPHDHFAHLPCSPSLCFYMSPNITCEQPAGADPVAGGGPCLCIHTVAA